MRLLVVTNMYPGRRKPNFGVFVADRVDAYRSLGADVEVVANTDPRKGIRVVVKYASLLLRAVWAAAKFRPDVVEGHYLWPTGIVTAAAAAVARAPYVLYAHGSDIPDATAPVLYRWAVRRAAEIHTNSPDTAERLRRAVPDVGSVEVLPPGVDLDLFEPVGEPEPGTVVYVGDLVPHKGVDVLIRALTRLDETVRLVVVGDGPQAPELRRLADELGVADRILWVGAVDHTDVPRWLSRGAVVAVPSRRDALGQVAIEALACGRPVVVSDVGGLAAIPTSECGEAVAADDPGVLAEAIRRWLHPRRPTGVGDAARRRAGEYEREAVASRALERHRRLAAETRRSLS